MWLRANAIFSREPRLMIALLIHDCAFFGTLAPFFRASESPIAIACLRLFTAPPLPPFPERRAPFFLRRTALSTVFPAALPYLRPDFFFAAIDFLPSL